MENNQQTEQDQFINPGQEGSNNSMSESTTAGTPNDDEDTDQENEDTDSDFPPGNDANQAAFTNGDLEDSEEDTDENEKCRFIRWSGIDHLGFKKQSL